MTAPKIVMPSQIVMRATASLDGDGRTFAEIAEVRRAAH
jgi:hypothetical protein